MDNESSENTGFVIANSSGQEIGSYNPVTNQGSGSYYEQKQESVPSQNEIDLNDFHDNISPSTDTVIENANNNMNTPSIVIAEKKDKAVNSEVQENSNYQFNNHSTDLRRNPESIYNPEIKESPTAQQEPTVGPKEAELNIPSEGKGIAESKKDNSSTLEDYIGGLLKGRELTYEEVSFLREKHLSSVPGYEDKKKEYLDKGYNDEDIQYLLLNRDFKQDAEDFNKSLKDSNGKYVYDKDKTSYSVLIDLYEREKEEMNSMKAEQPKQEQEKIQDLKENKKQRDYKRIALVAGVITGTSAGLLVGGAAAASAIPVAVVAGIEAFAIEKIGTSRLKKLQEKISKEEDESKRIALEKRMRNWGKVIKFAGISRSFLTGASTGLILSSFISNQFMGGQGFLNKLNTPNNVQVTQPQEMGSTSTAGTQSSNINTTTSSQNIPETKPLETVTSTTVDNSSGVIVQNGRVNLPDSAWNSNLGGAPTVDLPGGEGNFSSYPGGIENMAAYQAEKDLAAAGLTRDQVLGNLGTRGVHSLLNSYQSQIASGTTNPELLDTLRNLSQYDNKFQGLVDIIANK